jgi:hypothetical protein
VGRIDRIRPYVEKLLKEGFNIHDLAPDPDGDYPFRYRSAGYFVRLYNEPAPTVQLFSVVVRDIKRTPKLLSKLNDINAGAAFVRVYWLDHKVIASTELVAETLDGEELGNACNVVGGVADAIGRGLVADFGGHVLFEEGDDAEPASANPRQAEAAGYL